MMNALRWPASSPSPSSSGRRVRWLMGCLTVMLAAISTNAQLTSSQDVNGNTVVLSTGLGTTSTLSTITATTAPSVNQGQLISSPTGTSSIAPPTTYLVYITVNGVQSSTYWTFTATTPTTPAAISPATGTVLQFSEYIATAVPTVTSKSDAKAGLRGFEKRHHGLVAALGIALSAGLAVL